MELQLEDCEAAATEDELAAEQAAAKTTRRSAPSTASARRRKPFPEHLPRERVVIAAPTSCPCCGSARLSKLGEDVTETLEVIPRQWKVIQTVREKFTCRECEKITQPPAPFHLTPRGFARSEPARDDPVREVRPASAAEPADRERYAREGIDLSLSTLADQVGACAVPLRPLHELIERHVLAAERLHGDDTTVPILAKGKTVTGRVWVYVRDDRPFGGPAPPAALFYASRDRTAEHPERHLGGYGGILQADAYAGYGRLYEASRSPGSGDGGALLGSCATASSSNSPTSPKSARRGKNAAPISPLALEAVKRIDALFDIEREMNGRPAKERLAVRQERSVAVLADLEDWMRTERARLSRHAPVAKAMDYMLKRWERLYPLHSRRPDLPDEQRGGTRAPRSGSRPQVMALRRLRSRRRSLRLHADADRDGQAQRHRSAGLARRRPRPHRRHPAKSARRTPALELATPRAQTGALTDAFQSVTEYLHPNAPLPFIRRMPRKLYGVCRHSTVIIACLSSCDARRRLLRTRRWLRASGLLNCPLERVGENSKWVGANPRYKNKKDERPKAQHHRGPRRKDTFSWSTFL